MVRIKAWRGEGPARFDLSILSVSICVHPCQKAFKRTGDADRRGPIDSTFPLLSVGTALIFASLVVQDHPAIRIFSVYGLAHTHLLLVISATCRYDGCYLYPLETLLFHIQGRSVADFDVPEEKSDSRKNIATCRTGRSLFSLYKILRPTHSRRIVRAFREPAAPGPGAASRSKVSRKHGEYG